MWYLLTLGAVISIAALSVLLFADKKRVTIYSLFWGIAFSALITLSVYKAIMLGFQLENIQSDRLRGFAGIFSQITALTIGFIVFREGRIDVPIKHLGALTFADARQGWCPSFQEGNGWTLPWVSDILVVDAKTFNIDPDPFDILSKDLNFVMLDFTILAEVICPARYENVDGLESILVELLRSEARRKCNDLDANNIAEQDGDITNAVREELEKTIGDGDWGIKIIKLRLENVTLPKEITESAAQKQSEIEKKKAELTAVEGLEERVEYLIRKFPDLTPAEAFNLAQTESGKIVPTVFKFENLDRNLIPGLVAVAQVFAGKGEKPKPANDGDES